MSKIYKIKASKILLTMTNIEFDEKYAAYGRLFLVFDILDKSVITL